MDSALGISNQVLLQAPCVTQVWNASEVQFGSRVVRVVKPPWKLCMSKPGIHHVAEMCVHFRGISVTEFIRTFHKHHFKASDGYNVRSASCYAIYRHGGAADGAPVAALALSHYHNGGHYHSPAHLSSDSGASAVTIDRLVVLPRFQGRGIKEWLIDTCCARLASSGWPVTLSTSDATAIKLLQRSPTPE